MNPGNNIADAVDLARDDLDGVYPDATRITVVVVAEIEQDGQEPVYQIGGSDDITIEDGERIVQQAGEATRGASLLRKLQRAGLLDDAASGAG